MKGKYNKSLIGKYRGPMPVEDFFQALFQDHEFFRSNNIRYISRARLYFDPCDENGDPVIIRNANGDAVEGYQSAGAYQSAANFYDKTTLNLQAVTKISERQKAVARLPYAPF